MADVHVSYGDLDSAANYLTTKQGGLESELRDLKGHISNLIASGFVTEKASVQFGETYDNFNKAAMEMVSNLENISKYLKQASQALQSLDTELASRAM